MTDTRTGYDLYVYQNVDGSQKAWAVKLYTDENGKRWILVRFGKVNPRHQLSQMRKTDAGPAPSTELQARVNEKIRKGYQFFDRVDFDPRGHWRTAKPGAAPQPNRPPPGPTLAQPVKQRPFQDVSLHALLGESDGESDHFF
jgi:predicted DNA-binding WGR domain protein